MALRTNYSQFETMVEFMEKYGDLSKPSGGPRGRQWCNHKWRELTEKLNCQGAGESRSEEKWKKVWSDLKNNTKKKWAKINKAVHATGGGPALKINLTDLESRVMAIMGVQAAAGMPVPEVGVTVQIQEETWNTPSTSTDPVLRFSPPCSPMKTPTPPPSTPPPPPSTPPHLPTPPILKKNTNKKITDIFIQCEKDTREYNRERDRVYEELERERIRQRDIELRQRDDELRLQAQWLQFMKEALGMIEKYLDGNK